MSTPINKYIPDLSKLKPFDGANYCLWSQWMVILFEQLEVDYVLFNPLVTKELRDSVTIPGSSDIDATKKRNMESVMLGSRNMSLERLKFQMADDKEIMDQVHVYEKLVFDILAEGMEMCEILQANILIEKLSKSWADYLNLLKHKKRDIPLERLISHMKIKEANRPKDKALITSSQFSLKASIVESGFGSGLKLNRFKNAGMSKKIVKY
ncbi:hypothetical protein PVK06_038967 [Gossypium arboreum]|uniref:Uncharacterized protein n=1 Tax=Gossypium arboreum TaxID=29729 RepID=A0ABR0N1L7_GOSAR|nr:hypothetical protein PVK06_038967 [Gossypium arboreum]